MTEKASPRSGMEVDAALVREMAELLKETDLSEIEVQDGDRRIRVVRQIMVSAPVAAALPPPTVAVPAAVESASPAPAMSVSDVAKHPGVVPSPMVGTAYLAPEPDKPDFISVGTAVKEGDTLMIIEAMKVMNPIAAPRSGVITHIFITSAQAVEYGEPLVVIA